MHSESKVAPAALPAATPILRPDDIAQCSVDSRQQRPIRSFVLRTSRLTDAQAQALQRLWSGYGLDYSGQTQDFAAIFTRAAPLVVEIGFGNGEALAECALADPQRNYLGIEVHTPGVGRLLRTLERQGSAFVRVYRHDAVEVLRDEIADAAIAELRVWFPDPWHKARHNKRRLIQPDFIEQIRPKLAVGGVLHLATDWQPYAQHMLDVMRGSASFTSLAETGDYSARPPSRPLTHFEQRGQRLGHGVWDLLYRRVS
jgi:tRNA (guanine-N7-)-methyltransferase